MASRRQNHETKAALTGDIVELIGNGTSPGSIRQIQRVPEFLRNTVYKQEGCSPNRPNNPEIP